MFNRKLAKKEAELKHVYEMVDTAQRGWSRALEIIDDLRAELRRMLDDPCRPQTWPSNFSYKCQHGHLHQSKGAIGGDFPV